ncbi:MAG: DUF3604 domain-containing protein [Gammaproteobacteria bacterium]
MKKVGGVFLALLLFISSFVFYALFILSVDEDQQIQTTLNDAYYQTDDSLKNNLLPSPNPDKNAYFGDLHIHTSNSFDAYTFGTLSNPELAYKYAQGESILHPTGYDIKLRRPLDFYAVTDHGVFLGLLPAAADTNSLFSKYEYTKPIHNLNKSISNGFLEATRRAGLFRNFARKTIEGIDDGMLDKNLIDEIQESVWKETIKAADDAYKPGIFTTFAAYEYTSSGDLYNRYLHRNVIFEDTKNLPNKIFTRLDSQNPEPLWGWMNSLRQNGIDSLAIPHNSNLSGGVAFLNEDFNGGPIDNAYTSNRLLNEPLVEITQAKGTSETHPLISKNDEWASFETAVPSRYPANEIKNIKGAYVRNAYLRGLAIEDKGIINPYKFGLIGSSDSHVGGGSYNEETFFSKIGSLDGTPKLRGSVPFNKTYGFIMSKINQNSMKYVDNNYYLNVGDRLIYFGASGLAGVWAEENTRESIFAAFRKKETFATSGPRIKVRFFGGYDLENHSLSDENLIRKAYSLNTPMGGDIYADKQTSPTFLIWAVSDPLGGKLQRSQIIKGWVENGVHNEKVFDVACSDGLKIDPITHRCPDNGADVNINDCSTTPNVGASELKTFWKDPEFNSNINAFYYVRVLENPSCRWSTWDAVRNGEKPRSDIEVTIQERAWSSPIWVKIN